MQALPSPLKVLQILYSGLGGHGSVAFSLVDGSEAAGAPVDHALIFYGVEGLLPDYAQRCQAQDIPYEVVTKKRGFDTEASKKLIAAIAAARPDVLILHSISIPLGVYRAIRANNIPIIAVDHTDNSLKRKLDWLGLFLAARFAQRIIVLNPAHRDNLERGTMGTFLPKDRLEVISNGIDLARFAPVETPRETLRVGMAARLTAHKDLDTLIRAVAHLPATLAGQRIELEIAGDGIDRPRLEALVDERELRDRITFRGVLNEGALIAFYQSLHVYAQATFGETVGMSVVQAMACGIPVVASKVKGLKFVEKNKAGLLVAPQNPEAMAEALLHFLRSPALREEYGARGRRLAVASYDAGKMWERYFAAIQRVINENL